MGLFCPSSSDSILVQCTKKKAKLLDIIRFFPSYIICPDNLNKRQNPLIPILLQRPCESASTPAKKTSLPFQVSIEGRSKPWILLVYKITKFICPLTLKSRAHERNFVILRLKPQITQQNRPHDGLFHRRNGNLNR